MSGNEDEYESNPSRRSILAVLGITAAGTAGSAGYIAWMLGGDDEDTGTVRYREDKTYDEDRDEVTYTTTPDRDPVDTWNEALPGECSLSADERHWLVGRVDSYDNLDGEELFEYVNEGKVRFEDRGPELRMEVDADYSGGEFIEDKGYNIPDTC